MISCTMKSYLSNMNIRRNAEGPMSKLPAEMISKIMTFMPLRDAAKLCLTSRNWFCAWKELRKLRFSAEFFADVLKGKPPTSNDLWKILSVILLSHVGPISGFYLCIPVLKSSRVPAIGPCLSFLSRNNVKNITIKNVQTSPLQLSYHLFSCLTLEKLTLDNCILNLLPCFEVMRKLKSIKLESVILMGNSFTDFLASCPALQSLTMKKCKGFEHIIIVAPNLKYLTVSGKFETVFLRSAEKLVDFSITLDGAVLNYQSAKTCGLIAYLAHRCCIKSLSFGGQFCKFLTAGKIGSMFPKHYRGLKSLHLANIRSNDPDESYWVLGMIQSCPVLEDLKISFSWESSDNLKIKFDPCYRLPCLREVHLSSVMGVGRELALIELLLRCSPVLETMFIKTIVEIPKDVESRLTRELISFRRASPEATVVYLDP